jgi:hypothetical protein
VTEIFSIFCEILSLFVKHCLLKGFYPYLNFFIYRPGKAVWSPKLSIK